MFYSMINISFKDALRERLTKLDSDYTKHRAALLAALACEVGMEPDARRAVEVPPCPVNMLPPDASNQLDVVRNAIASLVILGKKEFTKDDVRGKVLEDKPDISQNVVKNMSSFLWQLKRENFIKVKEKGQGQRQSVYTMAGAKKEPTLAGEGS